MSLYDDLRRMREAEWAAGTPPLSVKKGRRHLSSAALDHCPALFSRPGEGAEGFSRLGEGAEGAPRARFAKRFARRRTSTANA